MKRSIPLVFSLLLVIAILMGCSNPSAPPKQPAPDDPDAFAASLPGPDGGPMLYPVLRPRADTWSNQFRIVNQKGEFISDALYDSFRYVYSEDGKPWFVFVDKGYNEDSISELYSLSGKLEARFQNSSAYQSNTWAGGKIAYFPYLQIGHSTGEGQFSYTSSLFDLNTMSSIFSVFGLTNYDVIGKNTIRVTQSRYTSEPDESGWRDYEAVGVSYQKIYPDNPADTILYPDCSLVTGLYGFVDETGAWVISPVYESVQSFIGDYGAVCLPEGGWYFIDKKGNLIGEKRGSIQDMEYGWRVVPDGWQDYAYSINGQSEILSYDLKPLIPMTEGYIGYSWLSDTGPNIPRFYLQTDSLYRFYAGDGSVLGEITLEQYNANTTEPIDSMDSTWAHFVGGDIVRMGSSELALCLSDGKLIPMPPSSYIESITPSGNLYVSKCSDNGSTRYVVLNRDGEEVYEKLYSDFTHEYWGQSVFTECDYYWVTQGRWQGYVDRDGNWRYRESRYQFLDD